MDNKLTPQANGINVSTGNKDDASSSQSENYTLIKPSHHVIGVLASDFNPVLATIGFFIGGALCFWIAINHQEIDTWIRFPFVIAGAGAGSYLIGRFGNAILLLTALIFGVGVITALGYMIWISL